MENCQSICFCLLIIIIIILSSRKMEGFKAEPRYGGVNINMKKIDDTYPIITFSAQGLNVPNSYSYANIATSIDGKDSKQPDNNPTAVSDIQIAKNALNV